jgi:hypothetical protein
MKKSKPAKKNPAPAKAPEKFSFCVGCPCPVDANNPDGTHISVYTHHAQVQYGTMADAERFRDYVNEQTKEENFVYELVAISPKKKKK